MNDTTSRIYALLMGRNESTGADLWESCPLDNMADFEKTARRLLGDRTEVTGPELDGCDWPELFSDFIELSRPEWLVSFVASLPPRTRETWEAMQRASRS